LNQIRYLDFRLVDVEQVRLPYFISSNANSIQVEEANELFQAELMEAKRKLSSKKDDRNAEQEQMARRKQLAVSRESITLSSYL